MRPHPGFFLLGAPLSVPSKVKQVPGGSAMGTLDLVKGAKLWNL